MKQDEKHNIQSTFLLVLISNFFKRLMTSSLKDTEHVGVGDLVGLEGVSF
jgi:hypothetical protein